MKRLLLGVGNRLSSDDGVGPTVAASLAGAEGWTAIDCGTALANASGIVSRESPDLLVLVDAARMGLAAGAVRRLPTDGTDRMLASTHGLPLPFVIDRMRAHVGEVILLGIEPASLALGEALSPEVATAAEWLVERLRRLEHHQISEYHVGQTPSERAASGDL